MQRHQLGIVLDGDTPAPLGVRREEVHLGGYCIGILTNCVWSYRLKANISYVLVHSNVPVATEVTVMRAGGPCQGRLVNIPFV